MGISMGGYLAARACAFESRIKACILNGGVYAVDGNLVKSFPPTFEAMLDMNPAKVNEIMYDQMKSSVTTSWFFNNGMWVFDAASPAEMLVKLRKYTLKDVVKRIKCPTLVIDSEADQFFQGQPQQVYNDLTSPKTLLKFTSEESAQAHCQMGAVAISNAKILEWLGDTFKMKG